MSGRVKQERQGKEARNSYAKEEKSVAEALETLLDLGFKEDAALSLIATWEGHGKEKEKASAHGGALL